MSIVRLILRRLLLALSTLALVSLVIFAMVEWLPGDVAKMVLGRFATPESIAMLRQSWDSMSLPTFDTSPGSKAFFMETRRCASTSRPLQP